MSSGVLTCLCGSINLPIENLLPGKTELCHCNPCRHTTGALFAGWITLSVKPPEDVIKKCTVYHSSNTHARYFCSTCGTKTFILAHHHPDGSIRNQWCAFGGAVTPQSGIDNVLNIETHKWLSDAGDIGMAAFMTKLNGRDVPCYDFDQNSKKIEPKDIEDLIQKAASLSLPRKDELLKGECRCGGVSFLIQRANPEDKSISQLDRFIPKDGGGNPTGRHMAFCCVCHYCRRHSGVSLTPWLYVPPVQVINPNTNEPFAQHREVDTPAGIEANKGNTLKHFWSSPDSCRSFCYICGASVFNSYDKRQEILNVAPGLLRAEEGALARRWLSWQWGRTAWWKEGTTQKDIMEAWQATASTS